jgi:hypothetical protein
MRAENLFGLNVVGCFGNRSSKLEEHALTRGMGAWDDRLALGVVSKMPIAKARGIGFWFKM